MMINDNDTKGDQADDIEMAVLNEYQALGPTREDMSLRSEVRIKVV